MNIRNIFIAILLTFGILITDKATATPIAIIGNGTATHTSQDNIGVQNPFTSNDNIHVIFSYESQTPDIVLDPNYGRYQITSISGTLVVNGESKSFGPNGGSVIDIQLFSGFSDYEWYLRGSILFSDTALGAADLGISLRGSQGGYLGAIYGDSLISPPNILLPASQWFVVLKQTGSPSVTGLGTMFLHVVPEPVTFALMTIGLAGLGFSRRQSARSTLSTCPRT